LLQSLVQGLCVAAEKRETEGTKKTKVVAVQKNLGAETKERTKDKTKREKIKVSCCSKLISFILCDYICVQAHVSSTV
jgi:hypothetical protein